MGVIFFGRALQTFDKLSGRGIVDRGPRIWSFPGNRSWLAFNSIHRDFIDSIGVGYIDSVHCDIRGDVVNYFRFLTCSGACFNCSDFLRRPPVNDQGDRLGLVPGHWTGDVERGCPALDLGVDALQVFAISTADPALNDRTEHKAFAGGVGVSLYSILHRDIFKGFFGLGLA